jgi:hypothetical protein
LETQPAAPADIHPHMNAEELRQSWQFRALDGTAGALQAVMMSIIDVSFEDCTEILGTLVFGYPPPWQPPFICSRAYVENGEPRIIKGKVFLTHTGGVYAEYITKFGDHSYGPFFSSTEEMQGELRTLADFLHLSDADRVAMFRALTSWLVADRRLDPSFDRNDPDAKRIIH